MTEKTSFCCGISIKGRDSRPLDLNSALHKVLMGGIRSYFDDPSASGFALDPILQPFVQYLIDLHNSTVDEHDLKLTIENLVCTAFKRAFLFKEIASRTAIIADIRSLRDQSVYKVSFEEEDAYLNYSRDTYAQYTAYICEGFLDKFSSENPLSKLTSITVCKVGGLCSLCNTLRTFCTQGTTSAIRPVLYPMRTKKQSPEKNVEVLSRSSSSLLLPESTRAIE